jgi:DNA-binding response OmpR family regulator
LVRVAVIDNDPALLDLTKALFEDQGWEAVPYRHGKAAVEAVKHDQPDVIILDLWLDTPETGWEVLQQLKASPETRSIPVIIWTGAQEYVLDKEEWLAQRGIQILLKPFEIDQLYDTINTALDRKVRDLDPQ